MADNLYNLNNQIFIKNNNLLLEILNDICQLMNNVKSNHTIKALSNIIIKINTAINEIKKNSELIQNELTKTFNEMDKKLQESKNNSLNDQTKLLENGNYIGQIVNGLAEGKGIWYGNKGILDGERYEGYWKNDKKNEKRNLLL